MYKQQQQKKKSIPAYKILLLTILSRKGKNKTGFNKNRMFVYIKKRKNLPAFPGEDGNSSKNFLRK